MLDLKEKHSRWQVTENNPDTSKEQVCERLAKLGTAIYVIVADEVGEASGTAHQHSFVIYKNAIRGSSLKKAFPRAHFEVCRGNNFENRDYLTKQGSFIEQGEMPYSVAPDRKRDIASEVLGLIVDKEQDPIDIFRSNPEYADYIVRNFKNLSEIAEQSRKGKWRKR